MSIALPSAAVPACAVDQPESRELVRTMIRNTLLRLRCNVSLFAAAGVAFVIANFAVAAVLSASSGPIVNAACTTTLSTTPAALNFAATKNGVGGDLITTTDPQAITVHFSGT